MSAAWPGGSWPGSGWYWLDVNAFSFVKTYRRGNGTTYPDMTWEPKQSFRAVADFYAGPPVAPGS